MINVMFHDVFIQNYIYVENVLSKNNIIETGSNDLMDHIDNLKCI